ncbi:MAG: hypothetical protein HQM09_15200 [Candidatus Riflebacteria bacterium]|nr:hypothetical protein [Candidatus Riflebacteria bacterium]
MNLLQLKNKVIQQLNENPDNPQFWTFDEIIDNLNEGYREIFRRTGLRDLLLPLLQAEAGAFYFPHDLMGLKKIYWQGRLLGKKSIEYLETRFSGTSHDRGLVGSGRSFSKNFRSQIGDPECWYLEDGKAKLFPIPEIVAASTTARKSLLATLAANSLSLTLSEDIPEDQSRVDIWLDGVEQNFDQWTIVNPRLIQFVGPASGVNLGACIRFIPDTVSMDLLATAKKFLVFLSAGSTQVSVPGGYVQSVGAVTIKLDGIEQTPTSFTESSPFFLTLDNALSTDSIAELSVLHPDPLNVASALYSSRPQEMSNNTDQPDMFEDLQRGIWQYACSICLTRDGRGQDVNKAAIFSSRFEKTISDLSGLFRTDITLDSAAMMPFQMRR